MQIFGFETFAELFFNFFQIFALILIKYSERLQVIENTTLHTTMTQSTVCSSSRELSHKRAAQGKSYQQAKKGASLKKKSGATECACCTASFHKEKREKERVKKEKVSYKQRRDNWKAEQKRNALKCFRDQLSWIIFQGMCLLVPTLS